MIEKKKSQGKKGDASGEPGFAEFFCANPAKHYPGWEIAEVRGEMLKYLKDPRVRQPALPYQTRAHLSPVTAIEHHLTGSGTAGAD